MHEKTNVNCCLKANNTFQETLLFFSSIRQNTVTKQQTFRTVLPSIFITVFKNRKLSINSQVQLGIVLLTLFSDAIKRNLIDGLNVWSEILTVSLFTNTDDIGFIYINGGTVEFSSRELNPCF